MYSSLWKHTDHDSSVNIFMGLYTTFAFQEDGLLT